MRRMSCEPLDGSLNNGGNGSIDCKLEGSLLVFE